MKNPVYLTGKQPRFRSRRSSNSYLLLFLLILVVCSLFLLRGVSQKDIKSPFEITPTPTRTSNNYALEAETHFKAGNLPKAIAAYQAATRTDPKNAALFSELARIQVYSSATLSTVEERRKRLGEALQSIEAALKINPDASNSHAIRAFVLDWSSSVAVDANETSRLLTDAEQAAVSALQLDSQNTLALAYYAEIYLDQQQIQQADQYIKQALARNPDLMDVHRINGLVQETYSNYNNAIKEYKKAAEITPNLTFLYIYIGANYRQLRLYDQALEYFTKAVTINKQLGINDPIPYLSIGNTYLQIGETFAAALNVQTALDFNPDNPRVYGTLGIVYFKSRNYEGAIPALKCAVHGCTAQESCDVRRCNTETDPPKVVTGMDLNNDTVVYYYTYGSVLAGMHRPAQPYCLDAVKVLKEVSDKYKSDADIMSIIQPSLDICASFDIVP